MTTAEIDHGPLDIVGIMQPATAPATKEQLTVVVPSVAVSVTVNPEVMFVSSINGVTSEVMLSVEDNPVSEELDKSGATGAIGAVVSITTANGADTSDTLLLTSVRVAVTTQLPSTIVGMSHESTPEAAVNVHDTVVLPCTAVTVTNCPSGTPVTLIVGVLSDVMLSSN